MFTPKKCIYNILPVKAAKVYSRIVNIFLSIFSRKVLTFLKKRVKYLRKLHTSLIKSGGGNGPMKPGNLAKS